MPPYTFNQSLITYVHFYLLLSVKELQATGNNDPDRVALTVRAKVGEMAQSWQVPTTLAGRPEFDPQNLWGSCCYCLFIWESSFDFVLFFKEMQPDVVVHPCNTKTRLVETGACQGLLVSQPSLIGKSQAYLKNHGGQGLRKTAEKSLVPHTHAPTSYPPHTCITETYIHT